MRETPREVEDELAFHFASVVEELMGEGRTREEAEAEAKRRFGDETRYRRELEAIDREAMGERKRRERLDAGLHTLRSALRSIRRSPALSAGVVLAFGLGIGANATMFGIVDRLLLSPPAHIENADEVHRILIGRSFLGRSLRVNSLSVPDYEDLQEVSQFAGVAAFTGSRRHHVGHGQAARPVRTMEVTGNYWSLLGTRAAVGRFFTAEEDRTGGERLVVLGWDAYQALFDGEPTAIGSTVDFGFGEYTVIGVAPRGFTGIDLERIDLFLPLQVGGMDVMGERWLTGGRGYSWLRFVARLAPGATVASAEAAATPLHRRGRAADIERGNYDANARVIAAPLIAARDPEGPKEARVAAWLAGVSAIVLLIACVNVANLLLARSIRQRRELAIRLAMGISRGRLIAHALTESVLLSLAGGLTAIVIARWGGAMVRALLLPDVAWVDNGLGVSTLLFTLALSVLTGLFAASVPAMRSLRHQVADVLRVSSGGITRSTGRFRAALSVAQAALSVILLVGSGLFVRSLNRVQSLDLGFDMNGLLIATPIDDGTGLDAAAMKQFFTEAEARLVTLPGIRSAASSIGTPFYTSWSTDVNVPGVDSIPTPPSGGPYVIAVSPAYLRTMDIRVTRGRDFEQADLASPMVALVNEAMAQHVWQGRDPLGDCMRIEESDAACTTIIGIVEDARRGSVLEQPNPQFYIPLTHPTFDNTASEMLYVRADRTDVAMINAIRDLLLETEPRLRYANVRPLAELTEREMRSWRLGASMFTVFGLLALIVASIGLYSVLAFDVAQRTREIGLRSALGAGTGRLLGEVLERALRMTFAGLAVGIAAALLLGPRLESLLYNTSPRDPLTFILVAAVLFIVSVLAGGIPAWRAARVDPNVALRAD